MTGAAKPSGFTAIIPGLSRDRKPRKTVLTHSGCIKIAGKRGFVDLLRAQI
jgi:hypothetical protein